jgi:hypothetical protein
VNTEEIGGLCDRPAGVSKIKKNEPPESLSKTRVFERVRGGTAMRGHIHTLPRRTTGTRGRFAYVDTMLDSSISGWASTASAVAAWLALLLSIINLVSTLRRENRREQRQRPLLVPYLRDGLVQRLADKSSRVYAFFLSISNRSDSNNSIREIELRHVPG